MNYEQVHKESESISERNDCAVKAVALATGVPYKEVHSLMARYGRKHRCGTKMSTTKAVLKQLGIEFSEDDFEYPVYYRNKKFDIGAGCTTTVRTQHSYSTKTIHKALPKRGRYLVFSRSHMSAFVNGKLEDWAENRRKIVVAVLKIS